MNFTKIFKQPKVQVIGMIIILVGCMAFAQVKQSANKVSKISLINERNGHFFIDESEVLASLNSNTELIYTDKSEPKILKKVETRIEANPFVKNAEVYRDIKGDIKVAIEQRIPIARILTDKQPDAYISLDGYLMPHSKRYAARVPLITGDYTSVLAIFNKEKTVNPVFHNFFKHIYESEFLRAQISQIDIDAKGNVILMPQVGNQIIYFGAIENVEDKFRRLMIAYSLIIPKKGWNHYKSIDLRFNDQIVCN